ncbi:uncharacterized protein LOC124683586 isoform X2 [Lolium rigidum]|uniref:uncharacterized protein LOC124683586 isoform X2 n=1 Tax=Lolium rigidum TaxID=89674 RepID=UPI001F5D733F|nr:uncharacterized protein LOC124683586 isoform X2 [Lolium rigidum]
MYMYLSQFIEQSGGKLPKWFIVGFVFSEVCWTSLCLINLRPETEVNILMQQVAGDYGLEVSVSFDRLPHTPSLPPRTRRMSTRTTSHATSPSSRPAAKRISLFQLEQGHNHWRSSEAELPPLEPTAPTDTITSSYQGKLTSDAVYLSS